jgi:hypothetical protein
MRHLQDIIQEGLLDVEGNDKKGEAWVWFDLLMNAKTEEDFVEHCQNLKKVLDKDLGKDYYKALTKAKQNAMGSKCLCIAIQDRHIGNRGGQSWSIFVSEGYFKVQLAWSGTRKKVLAYPSSGRIYDYVHAMTIPNRRDMNPNNNEYYSYDLNDEWNELRKAIIKETK